MLRKLTVGPMTSDQVTRFCLREADSLMSSEERAELESEIIRGAGEILAFDLLPFSQAIEKRERKKEQIQQGVEWSRVPVKIQELSKKRADYLLRFALEGGWVERDEVEDGWRISIKGRELLDRGGFTIR